MSRKPAKPGSQEIDLSAVQRVHLVVEAPDYSPHWKLTPEVYEVFNNSAFWETMDGMLVDDVASADVEALVAITFIEQEPESLSGFLRGDLTLFQGSVTQTVALESRVLEFKDVAGRFPVLRQRAVALARYLTRIFLDLLEEARGGRDERET